MTTPLSLFGRVVGTVLLAASSCVAWTAPAPVRDVAETLHGVTVHDPYRYFENVKDPQVQAWLKEQGALARQSLDRIAGRRELEARIAALSAATGDAVREIVRMPGDRIFFMKRGRTEKQYKLLLREGTRERVLVDPDRETARTGIPHAINWFVPSWDGEHVAYGMSAGGSEDASLFVVNVRTGRNEAGPIPRVHESLVSWLPDSKSFTYNQLRQLTAEEAETEFYLDSKVLWLRLGDPESRAKPVFGPTVTTQLGLDRLDVGALLFTPGSPWMIARTTDTTQREGSLFIARAADLQRGADVAWKRISKFEDKIVDIELRGNDLYYRTKQGAPRFKIMKLDLRQPELSRATEAALAPAGGVLEGFVLGREGLLATVRDGTNIGIRRYVPGDTRGQAVKLPFVGAASLQDDPAHAYDDGVYTLGSWTRPSQTYRLHGDISTELPLARRGQLAGVPAIEVREVKLPSHDGVMVPMTILMKKGIRLDGDNPTLLDGYGSYGFSETSRFSAASLAWIERGGVLALVNVRGSGVYGDDWRLAGFKATKANTWKDGVAAAQWLIAQGYASPRTLAVMGTSAGGIFVGRAVTSAPQLFAAAIFNVGVMDAVRAEESANGITNISEFGSYKDPKEFPALLEMSAYHQIRDGTAYPAVMLVHGLNDPRVDVWQSAKAAARLQAATSSGKPILLRLDAQAGHGVGSSATQRYALGADIYSFLLWQMGKAVVQ